MAFVEEFPPDYNENPRLDENGWEVLDSTKPYMPAGFSKPERLIDQIRRLIKTEWSQMAAQAGEETFDEADDFDVGDDFDPSSPYETFFDPVLQREVTPEEFERNAESYRSRYAEAHKQFFEKVDRDQILGENLYRRAAKKASGTTPEGSSQAGNPAGSSEGSK